MRRKWMMHLTPLVLTLIVGGKGSGIWPMFGHDRRHTGLSSFRGPTTGVAANWTHKYDVYYASPVIDSTGRMYIGAIDGNVICVDVFDGSLIWTFLESAWATIALDEEDDALYFGTYQSEFISLTMSTGTQRWATTLQGKIHSSAVVDSDIGAVYTADQGGFVWSLSTANGMVRWSLNLNAMVQSSPAIAPNGLIVISSYGNMIFGIHPGNGTVAWSAPLHSASFASPAVSLQGVAFIGDRLGYLTAVDTLTGSIVWSVKFCDLIDSTPAIFANETRIVFGCQDGSLINLDVSSNEPHIVWKAETGNVIEYGVVVDADANVFIANGNGVSAFNGESGHQVWHFETTNLVEAVPCIGPNRTIVVASTDTSLTVLIEVPGPKSADESSFLRDVVLGAGSAFVAIVGLFFFCDYHAYRRRGEGCCFCIYSKHCPRPQPQLQPSILPASSHSYSAENIRQTIPWGNPEQNGYILSANLHSLENNRVFLMRRDGREYVVKESTCGEGINHGWEHEHYVLGRLRSVTIVRLVEHFSNFCSEVPVPPDQRLPDGARVWIVVEHLCGGTLLEFFRTTDVTLRRKFEIICDLLHALVHIHSLGMAHCDLKPENLVFRDTSEHSHLVLIDFQLAFYKSRSTTEFFRIGTKPYMSEERLDRAPSAADAALAEDPQQVLEFAQRDDIFAVRLLLLLTFLGSPIQELFPDPENYPPARNHDLFRAVVQRVSSEYPQCAPVLDCLERGNIDAALETANETRITLGGEVQRYDAPRRIERRPSNESFGPEDSDSLSVGSGEGGAAAPRDRKAKPIHSPRPIPRGRARSEENVPAEDKSRIVDVSMTEDAIFDASRSSATETTPLLRTERGK